MEPNLPQEPANGGEPPPVNLNVVADDVLVYQGGNLLSVDIDELLDNEVAIRQLVNEVNKIKRLNKTYEDEINHLKIERSGYLLQPWLLLAFSVINVIGVVLVGVAANYVTETTPPPASWIVLVSASLVVLVTAAAPVALPILIEKTSRLRRNAN